ncbi:hypothetical protein PAMP_019420 [Pampus punctatissimus]
MAANGADNTLTRVEMETEKVGSVFEDKTAEEERRREMVLSMQLAFSQCLDAVAGILARGLNVLLQYVTHFLQAAGIQVGLPVYTVTPGGVIFVAQWVLLFLIGYGVIYLAFRLATFFLRWLCRLLKVGVFFACFGLIVNDYYVRTETTVTRLVCLWYICIFLGIRLWKDHTMAARIVYLEKQVKVLENQDVILMMNKLATGHVCAPLEFPPMCDSQLFALRKEVYLDLTSTPSDAISYVLQGEAGEVLLFKLKSTANICAGIFTFPLRAIWPSVVLVFRWRNVSESKEEHGKQLVISLFILE